MELIDHEGWQRCVRNNSDPYGKACIDFAERWANLMEARIAAGQTVEQCAKDTIYEADTEGITVFMYGAAVSMLSHVWKHGERLRRWHNLDTQIGSEGEKANASGGVLNPAILNLEME